MSPNPDPEADHQAVTLVLAGDLRAFEHIVRRWQSPLVNLAYRFTRDRSRAEDLAQEAFLRAFRNLHSWRRDAAFSTWLFALATNLYCTELRRIPPRPLPFADILEPCDTHDLAVSLQQRDEAAALHRAVDTLPPKYREVLILYYFQEMDVQAAASALRLPEGTVKARLSRARALLRAKLQTAPRALPSPTKETA